MAADLRTALQNLVDECNAVRFYVNQEAHDDESDRFNDALKDAQAALDGAGVIPSSQEQQG
jgi:hypothetical protein